MNKKFGALEKENFDKKLSIYLRTKKFPELSTSFETSATTIDKCKHELFKGVQRLNTANETIELNNEKAKDLNEVFLQKLKVQNEK